MGGYKYEVCEWAELPMGYKYNQVYAGDWLIVALWHALKSKKKSTCVKIEWRG